MDLGSPVLDVAPTVRGALLQALARLEQPVTRRQLAAAAGVAPGHAVSDSDFDLLIVAGNLTSPNLHDRLSRLHSDARSGTGNDLQLVEHTDQTWQKLAQARNPLVEQIRREVITLAGEATPLRERRT